MRNGKLVPSLAALLALVVPATAFAYVGPGLGVGAITAFFGAVFAVLAGIVGVIWYPIKRLLRRKKAQEAQPGNPDPKP
jgi:hypothetical protein